MMSKCRQAVEAAAKAAGRAIPTDAQYARIEAMIGEKMRELGRRDPAKWMTLSRDQQMQAAGGLAMSDIAAEAARKLANAQRQIIRSADTTSRIQRLWDSFSGVTALEEKIAKGNYTAAEQLKMRQDLKATKGHTARRVEALKRDVELSHIMMLAERKAAQGDLMKLIEAAGDTKGVGFGRAFLMRVFDADNPAMTRDVVREIFAQADGHTKNDAAKAAAEAWLKTIEGLRTRFNAAGGDIGQLGYGWVPQPWDTAKVRAGRDALPQFLMDHVDRAQYVHEDGSRLNDVEMFNFLNEAVNTLAHEGINKQEPGAYKGQGARANRGGDHRVIHFKDGASWNAVMSQYGRGSIYDAMMGHISGITRDITLVERYGPNANATWKLQMDLTALADETQIGRMTNKGEIEPQTFWDMVTGKTGAPRDETLSHTFQTIRNLQTSAKLLGAVISSVTDLGTLALTAGYNRLPYWQLLKDIGAQGWKENRDWMSSHGMISESAATAINRWSGDHLGNNWSGKLANSTLRWSLLNAWTDGLRQGFTLTMNAKLAEMTRKDWGSLHEFDRSRLTRAGFTEGDWASLGQIAPTQWKGRELMTPQTIVAATGDHALAAKLFGFLHDESEFAIVNPDLKTRAIVTGGGLQAGTVGGELVRTAMQFKSFPIAMATRHWARMLEGDHNVDGAPKLANRLAYGASLMVTATALGAVATQEKQMLGGKDPINMKSGRFWAKAIAMGGGFGIAGDIFLIDPAGGPGDMAATLSKNTLGPAFGTVIGDLLGKNVIENVWQAAEGKDTHWEAELFSWAKQQTPGLGEWWLKPVLDHAFMNSIQENLSPGYLGRMQQRAYTDWGQRYWYAPRDKTPQRAPDPGAAWK